MINHRIFFKDDVILGYAPIFSGTPKCFSAFRRRGLWVESVYFESETKQRLGGQNFRPTTDLGRIWTCNRRWLAGKSPMPDFMTGGVQPAMFDCWRITLLIVVSTNLNPEPGEHPACLPCTGVVRNSLLVGPVWTG